VLLKVNVPVKLPFWLSRSKIFIFPYFISEETDQEDLIQWLKNSKAPWVEVIENWKKTARQRLKELRETPGDVHDYVSQYPGLQDDKGYTLVSFLLLRTIL